MDDLTKMAALRMIPYGFYVLTAYSGKGYLSAQKVNWVTQTSFAPPLVAVAVRVGVGRNMHSSFYDTIITAGVFALNMLRKDQKDVAFSFFKPLDDRGGRLNGQLYGRFTTGAPVLVQALATIECKVVSTVELGDHYIVIGEVIDAHLHKPPAGRPDAEILQLKDLGDNIFYGG